MISAIAIIVHSFCGSVITLFLFVPPISILLIMLCYAMQVMIGTAELKANHSIQQIVEVISDHEKYPRYVLLTFCRT
jgi:hypothetical protein